MTTIGAGVICAAEEAAFPLPGLSRTLSRSQSMQGRGLWRIKSFVRNDEDKIASETGLNEAHLNKLARDIAPRSPEDFSANQSSDSLVHSDVVINASTSVHACVRQYSCMV